ncbi:hypothetical protein F5Y05DRAFT_406681 [Hypoxylon sp. FL0543]|nr:hypothetical protein F5Y05DRAFT_406681 [Hypoxylon sp. FL0543]
MEAAQNKQRRNVSRRIHTKSRNSCIPCRQRRVRCNLQAPICANCHRRNESCSYRQNTQEFSLDSLDAHIIMAQAEFSNAAVIPVLREFPELDSSFHGEDDFYEAQIVAEGLNASPVTGFVEKTFFLSGLSIFEKATFVQEFERQARAFKYVHRTMTALYALYESCQGKSHPNLQVAAYQNHIEASVLFRQSQVQVNEGNWMAILVFGIGVIVFQFADALRASDEADGYLQVLYVLRNSCELGSEVAPYLLASPIMRFTGPQLSQLKFPLNELIWDAICGLDSLDYPKDTADTIRCACLHSIAALKEWVTAIDGHPRNWRHFIHWPAAVSAQYLSALSHKHPVALVVFVSMKHIGKEWDHLLEFPRIMLASEARIPDLLELAPINC